MLPAAQQNILKVCTLSPTILHDLDQFFPSLPNSTIGTKGFNDSRSSIRREREEERLEEGTERKKDKRRLLSLPHRLRRSVGKAFCGTMHGTKLFCGRIHLDCTPRMH
jgi:hypothetical protein